MKRRKFISLLGGAAVSWPLAARAQQPTMPVVGFVRSSSLADSRVLVTAFRDGLRETGFVEGQNVAIEYRYADNQIDRLPILVADLIERSAAMIVGNTPSALAAKAAFCGRRRSGRLGPCHQPQPTGGERHRSHFSCRRAGGKATGAPAPACTERDSNWRAGESEQSRYRG